MAVRMPEDLTIVYVPLKDSWDCERCNRHGVVAYVHVGDDDETQGYCARCLGLVVVTLMALSEPEDDGVCPEVAP